SARPADGHRSRRPRRANCLAPRASPVGACSWRRDVLDADLGTPPSQGEPGRARPRCAPSFAAKELDELLGGGREVLAMAMDDAEGAEEEFVGELDRCQ